MRRAPLNGRSFNIRLSFDENGEPVIGYVHGLYDIAENITDIKPVTLDEKEQLSRALGVRLSSESFALNRRLRAVS